MKKIIEKIKKNSENLKILSIILAGILAMGILGYKLIKINNNKSDEHFKELPLIQDAEEQIEEYYATDCCVDYIGNKIIDDYFLVYYFKASENDNIYLKVIYTFERYTDSSVKGWKFKRVVQTWKEEVNETLELE